MKSGSWVYIVFMLVSPSPVSSIILARIKLLTSSKDLDDLDIHDGDDIATSGALTKYGGLGLELADSNSKMIWQSSYAKVAFIVKFKDFFSYTLEQIELQCCASSWIKDDWGVQLREWL